MSNDAPVSSQVASGPSTGKESPIAQQGSADRQAHRTSTITRRPLLVAFVLSTLALGAVLGVTIAQAVCIPAAYTVIGAPPPSANWTDTSGLWNPSGGFPGCAPGDLAADTNASPTTIIINSAIPNPIVGLNLACNGCVIDIQPGGQLTLAGFGSIGTGATLRLSGGTLTLASAGVLTFQPGGLLDFSSGMIDIQTGGQMSVDGNSSIGNGATLQVSGGTLTLPGVSSLNFQSGSMLSLIDGIVNGSGVINDFSTVQMSGSSLFPVNAVLANSAGGTVNVLSGTLSLAGGGTGDGPFTIASGATLDFPAGEFDNTTKGTIMGAGTLSVTGATLSIGGVTSPDGFTMTAGTLTGPGFLTIGKTMTWSGGMFSGTGGTQLAGLAMGNLTGANGAMILDGRSFDDYGHMFDSATANALTLQNNSTFSVFGTFELTDDGSIVLGSPAQGSVVVAPNGLLEKTGGNGTSSISTPLTNNATVWDFTGTLNIAGNGTHDGAFAAWGAGHAIAFNAPNTIVTNAGAVYGDGTIAFPGGSTTLNGFFGPTGLTSISGSALVTFNSDGSTNDFSFTGGNLTLGTSFFEMDAMGTWSGGTMTGSVAGAFGVAPGATMTIDAAAGLTIVDTMTFVSDGTVKYTATTLSGNYLNLMNGAVISNGGLFDIQTDQPIVAAGPPIGFLQADSVRERSRSRPSRPPAFKRAGRTPVANGSAAAFFDNCGTLEKTAGSGTTNIDPALTTCNEVKALSGTMNFTNSYTQNSGETMLGPGNISVATPFALAGGVLDGAGTLTGDLVSSGNVAPGTASVTGVINVTGSYTQNAGGTLTIKLAGSAVGQFDVLNVGNNATLDGTFTATLLNSYSPPNATVWIVFTFAAASGTFATQNLPTYPINGSIVSSSTPTSFVLSAVVTTASANLGIAVNGPPNVNAGAPLAYTATVSSTGPDPTSGTITVIDTLPTGATAATGSGSGWACGAPSGGTITCTTNAVVSNGGSLPILTFNMNAPPNPGIAQNSATVSAVTADPSMANNTGSASTNVIAQADLQVTKTGPVSAGLGQNIVYTIVAKNNGPSDAVSVQVTDPTPPGLTFVSNAGACTNPFPCNVGTLTAGQSATITSTFNIPGNYASSTVTNTASMASASTPDPNASNNSSTFITSLSAQADLSITKIGPPSLNVGQTFSYTIAVSNGGPLSADNVFVSDATPAGLTFVSNSGACTGPFPCGLGTLASGQSVSITSTYTLAQSFGGTSVSNTATVSSSTPDANTPNNTSTSTASVSSIHVSDLAIAKTGPAIASPFTNVNYAISVLNNGPNIATNVLIADSTPAGLQFLSNSGACTNAYPCTIPSLAPGQLVIINSIYFVQAQVGTSITNTASVSSASSDPTPANNSSSTTLKVVPSTVIACPTLAPQLQTPAAGATVTSPVSFSWTAVANATSYTLTVTGTVTGIGDPVNVTTSGTTASLILASGAYNWSVKASGAPICQPVSSGTSPFIVCNDPVAPLASVVGTTTTGQTYSVQWTSVDGATTYEVQEAGDAAFTNPSSSTVTLTTKSFTKSIQSATPFFYRVRAISGCNQASGPFSPTISVVVVPVPPPGGNDHNVNVPSGSRTPVVFQVFIPGLPAGPAPFVATVDKPWLAVTPTSGIIPPEGILLTVSADPSTLTDGTWTGTVIVVYGSPVTGKMESDATAPSTSVPVSISLTTPVSPGPLSQISSSALVIPSVGHLAATSSDWQSDVRIGNVSFSSQKYLLSFNQGTVPPAPVKQTTVTVDSGATIALDDIVRNWYGIGNLKDSSNGVLIVQPLDANGKIAPTAVSVSTTTVVSSRTYNSSSTGTLGQFIPATPFSAFISSATGANAAVLTLQQIAQSATYHTNLGVVEASGQPANVVVSVFDALGTKLLDLPLSLGPGEQRQLNSFLAANNISLTNGRVQVQVSGGPGRVTSYASVVDNSTNDPLLVSGVPLGGLGSNHFVLPGIADLNNSVASWRSDLRVFNGGTSPQNATLTFYPSGNPAAALSQQVTLNPGEVKALDNVLQAQFGVTNLGGALHLTTATAAPLVVTARTYDQTSNGTLGQFIQAVTANDAVGSTDRSLNILQAEESARYRTNLGIAEIAGKPVTVEISVFLPDSKVSPKVQIQLAANDYQQFPILSSLGIGATYNARISVRVVSGDGKITACGSVIDMKTQDPTYIPAQ